MKAALGRTRMTSATAGQKKASPPDERGGPSLSSNSACWARHLVIASGVSSKAAPESAVVLGTDQLSQISFLPTHARSIVVSPPAIIGPLFGNAVNPRLEMPRHPSSRYISVVAVTASQSVACRTIRTSRSPTRASTSLEAPDLINKRSLGGAATP